MLVGSVLCLWLCLIVLRWWCVAAVIGLVALATFGFVFWFDLLLADWLGWWGGLVRLVCCGWAGCFVVWVLLLGV